MQINADFSRPIALAPSQLRWVASPRKGVERIMLDRLGAEKGRATSIVRYAPRTGFPRHAHPGGEEILVLSGTFSDDSGDYPAGWYLRNPPGSFHSPSSEDGAEIFVKLQQMRQREEQALRIDTRNPSSWRSEAGRELCLLFADGEEYACLQRLRDGQGVFSGAVDGAELLVLGGEVAIGRQLYPEGSWIRLPAGDYPEISARAHGTLIYLKTGKWPRCTTGNIR